MVACHTKEKTAVLEIGKESEGGAGEMGQEGCPEAGRACWSEAICGLAFCVNQVGEKSNRLDLVLL